MRSVTVQIPATTANLGPGFDCLGVALQIYNRVVVHRRDENENKSDVKKIADHPPIIAAAADAFFKNAQRAAFDFDLEISGDVPRSRGLGSSVTVRLGLLHALNVLSELPLSSQKLFEICVQLEGHPDNAAPAAFGGFTVAGGETIARFEVLPSLRFVLLIPDFEIATPDARRVLPMQLDRLAAVQSCANACRVTAAFAAHRYELLRGAFRDGLHQPFRKPLIPFLDEIIAAGENAGALGGFLSGSGSTICCVAFEENAQQVADAMRSKKRDAKIAIAAADNEGAKIF